MTRETKVGLVVACSFLCLVGIVVASKMNGGGDPSETQESKEAPNQVAAAEKQKPKELQPVLPPAPLPSKQKPAIAPSPSAPELNLAAKKTDAQTQAELLAAKARNQLAPTPPIAPTNDSFEPQKRAGEVALPVPSNPLPNTEARPVEVAQATAPMPPKSGAAPPSPVVPPESETAKPPVPTPMGLDKNAPGLLQPPPVLPLGKDGPAPLPAAPVGEPKTKPGVPMAPTPEPIKPAVPLPAPNGTGSSLTGPAPGSAGPSPLPPAQLNPAPVPPANLNPAPLPLPASSGPVPEAPNQGNPAPLPLLPIAPQGKVGTPPGSPNATPLPPAQLNPTSVPPANLNPAPLPPTNIEPKPAPPAGVSPPPPSVAPAVIASKELPSTPPIPLTPPNAGATPSVGIGNLPSVRSTTSDVAVARQGETFAQMSKRIYGDEKYAAALSAYNRANAGALRDGSVFQYNPSSLNAGQQVLTPPKNRLESDYPKLITTTATTPTIPPVFNTPARLTPVVPASTPVVTTTAAGARVYTVQTPGGESIRDIAQRALGDPNRWTEIYRLNPSIQPQFAVPSGSRLTLP